FNSANINLNLTASDVVSDVTHYYIFSRVYVPSTPEASAPSSGDSVWLPFSTPYQQSYSVSKSHMLTGADGSKEVFVWYKDAAGNVGKASGSPRVVGLDTKAPLPGHEGLGEWTLLGQAGFSSDQANFLSLAFNGSTPYVAYKDGTSATTIKYYSGNSWVDVARLGSADWVSMCIFNGVPHITYQNLATLLSEVQKHYGGWYMLGSALDMSWYNAIYSLNGSLYVSYREINNGGKATVMKFDGVSSWNPVGGKGFSAGQVYNVPLDTYNGIIYCAFTDFSTSKVSCMQNSGSAWSYVGATDFGSGSEFVDLKIINGRPYVAFPDKNNSYKATVMAYNGTSWVSAGDTGSFIGGTHMINLVNYDNSPCIIFCDSSSPANGKLSAKKLDGSTWKLLGAQGFSTGGVWHHSSQTNGSEVFTAYTDGSRGNLASAMKYQDMSNNGLDINNGARLTTVRELKMHIYGTDKFGSTPYSGIEKYLIKYNDFSAPAAGDSGWMSMPIPPFDNDNPNTVEVDFILPATENDGLKIFYLWFKDRAGNVSATAQKSIKLDT
ncbi:MAG TPA: hypothetical protein PKL57_19150, partial [Candidatus Wallbacteria bacterium]|nr:hypothetical protein [Candidatus Wallbacteria bacterium]